MHKILIVDDEEINREVLKAGLSDIFEIVEAEGGKKALEHLYFDELIDAVLLDLNMPEVNGFDVLTEMNKTGMIQKIPVFVVTSANDDKSLLQAYESGAVDVVSKPFNIKFLRRRVVNTIELYTQRNNLSLVVEEKTKELVRQNNRLVEAMADIVEFRSNESGTHVKRVSGFTRLLMQEIINTYDEYRYLQADIESISFAACLHDLGKIAVPDSILNKPGKLTAEEFEIMKAHTVHGYEQILTLKDIMDPKLYEYSLDIAIHHHERFDGRGYPDKLKGDQLTIWSQAVALSDVYDALTTERCYKNAYDHETACKMIFNGECGVFNPKIMDVFKKLQNRFNELRQGIMRQKVFLIDDSDIDRSTLKTILQKNYDVSETSSPEKAVKQLKANPGEFDAVVIDVLMPEMDGFAVLKHLGKDFVERTPVLMCSSEVNSDIINNAANAGVKTFLKKPFDCDVVLKKLSLIIGE